MMDGWSLPAQWVVLLTLAAVFYGCTWWLAQRRARQEDREQTGATARLAVFVRSFGVLEWAVTALFVAFLVPLAVTTLSG